MGGRGWLRQPLLPMRKMGVPKHRAARTRITSAKIALLAMKCRPRCFHR